MDHFGIGTALTAAARIYFQTSRRTGRTTSMIDDLKDGDRVIFSNNREADRVRRLTKEAGKAIECIVEPPTRTTIMLGRGTSQGRTIFDHSWVEEYYLAIIERAKRDIDIFQMQLSGSGEPHRETKIQSMEMKKWIRY